MPELPSTVELVSKEVCFVGMDDCLECLLNESSFNEVLPGTDNVAAGADLPGG